MPSAEMPCRLFQCLSVSALLVLQNAFSHCFLALTAEDAIFHRLGLVCRPSLLPFWWPEGFGLDRR